MSIINQTNADTGSRGEKLLASGNHIAMRLWNKSLGDFEEKTPHQSDYETIGYVISGQAQLIIGDSTTSLNPGDSWVVPENVEHHYRILEDFIAVEATYPPARRHTS